MSVLKHTVATVRSIASLATGVTWPCFSKSVPSSAKVLYVFYDIETTEDTVFTATSFMHVPNLLYAQQLCAACIDVDSVDTPCSVCGIRKWSFWERHVEEFTDYLCKPRNNIDKIVAIAHNAKSFDSQFLLNHTIKRKLTPNILFNGTKIICMRVQHFLFMDSLNFLPMALRNFPKAFGLHAQRGFYPHYFNTMAKLTYVGEYPEVSYYGVDTMKGQERSDFLAW